MSANPPDIDFRWGRKLGLGGYAALWVLALLIACGLLWASLTDVGQFVVAPGSLQPDGGIVSLKAPANGYVKQVRVRSWAQVKENEVMLELDTLAMSPGESQARLAGLRQAVQESELRLKLVRLELDQAIADERASSKLLLAGVAPAFERRQAELAVQRARLNAGRAELEVTSARKSLELGAGKTKVYVKSPVTGDILEVFAGRAGEAIGAGQALASIVPTDRGYVFMAEFADSERHRIGVGLPVRVAWNGYPSQVYGESRASVVGISPYPEVGPGGSIYQVRIALDSLIVRGSNGASYPIPPGTSGTARVLTGHKRAIALFADWLRGLNQ